MPESNVGVIPTSGNFYIVLAKRINELEVRICLWKRFVHSAGTTRSVLSGLIDSIVHEWDRKKNINGRCFSHKNCVRLAERQQLVQSLFRSSETLVPKINEQLHVHRVIIRNIEALIRS